MFEPLPSRTRANKNCLPVQSTWRNEEPSSHEILCSHSFSRNLPEILALYFENYSLPYVQFLKDLIYSGWNSLSILPIQKNSPFPLLHCTLPKKNLWVIKKNYTGKYEGYRNHPRFSKEIWAAISGQAIGQSSWISLQQLMVCPTRPYSSSVTLLTNAFVTLQASFADVFTNIVRCDISRLDSSFEKPLFQLLSL